MTVGEFLERRDQVYKWIDIITPTYVHFGSHNRPQIMQWTNRERYTVKDENGQDVILKRFSPNSYLPKTTEYNVIACFITLAEEDDDVFQYRLTLDHIADTVQRNVDEGKMKLDEPIYLLYGQSVDDDDLYEIKEIYGDSESVDVYTSGCIDKDDC